MLNPSKFSAAPPVGQFYIGGDKMDAKFSAMYEVGVKLRPQAEQAFREGNYSKAAELDGRIRERLSPAEVKKLAFAEARVRD